MIMCGRCTCPDERLGASGPQHPHFSRPYFRTFRVACANRHVRILGGMGQLSRTQVMYIPQVRSKKVKALSQSEFNTGQIRLWYKWSSTRRQVELVLLGAVGLQSGTLPLGQDAAQGNSSRLRALIL